MPLPKHFDTQLQPLADRFEYWADAVGTQVVPVEIDLQGDSEITAGLTSSIIGATKTIEGFGGNHTFERTIDGIKREDPNALLVAFPTVGSPIVDQDDRQAIVANGDMVFIDSSRPFQVIMREPFRWQIFAMPKTKLRLPAAQLQRLTAISLPCTPGISHVVQGALKTMIRQSAALERDSQSEAVGNHAIDLIATLIDSVFSLTLPVHNEGLVLLQRVVSFIHRHHADPQLTPGIIARAHHISLRSLHNAFTTTGSSVMDTLRSVRIENAGTDLDNPYFRHFGIARIAQSHGFASASDFSRSFRKAHGVTPTQFRESRQWFTSAVAQHKENAL